MECGIVLLAVVYRFHQRFVLKECSVLDLLGDTCKFLIHDAACAHVQVAHFGVTHLSVGKSDSHAASISFYKRALCHQLVDNRCVGLRNRVMLLDIA